MPWFLFLKGATMYEVQVWRFHIGVPYWRFIKAGCRVRFGFDTSDRGI